MQDVALPASPRARTRTAVGDVFFDRLGADRSLPPPLALHLAPAPFAGHQAERPLGEAPGATYNLAHDALCLGGHAPCRGQGVEAPGRNATWLEGLLDERI